MLTRHIFYSLVQLFTVGGQQFLFVAIIEI